MILASENVFRGMFKDNGSGVLTDASGYSSGNSSNTNLVNLCQTVYQQQSLDSDVK